MGIRLEIRISSGAEKIFFDLTYVTERALPPLDPTRKSSPTNPCPYILSKPRGPISSACAINASMARRALNASVDMRLATSLDKRGAASEVP
jgi:hypothetical protein